MATDVNAIKDQFARFLDAKDSATSKTMAEYYLKTAAILKTKDIDAPKNAKLWIRNCLKRLFLGIGCELLIRAFYLREGYCINKPKKGSGVKATPMHKVRETKKSDFDHRNTYTLAPLIDHLKAVHQFQSHSKIEHAFRIAAVFRNKEGHLTIPTHKFDPQDYRDIETGLRCFYQEAFSQQLTFRISMKPRQRGVFKIARVRVDRRAKQTNIAEPPTQS